MKTYVNDSGKEKRNEELKNGQELIWDSGSGFDVVSFKNTSKLFNGDWADCQMKTGIAKGKIIPIDKRQLEEFSLTKWAALRKRYNNAC
jgi:hypothetical protein